MVGRLRAFTIAVVATSVLSACGAAEENSDSASAPGSTKNEQLNGQPGPPVVGKSADTADGEQATSSQPVSTFAVDVDTASYGYAKRLLLEGRRPAAGNIRPEEFVNSFEQGYKQPEGDGFAIATDGSRLPPTHQGAGDGARLMRVGLQTKAVPEGQRSDSTLTFVVDVSGSMAEPGKLD